jgi:TetR/AcrR family transcriptional regulator, lmrAB and yxaGH operons repressor
MRGMSTDSVDTTGTRVRILRSAQYLFRKRGYSASGLNEILEMAQAPKGSLYHHFPAGKEQIGVAVIEQLTDGILALFAASKARSTSAMVRQVGAQLATTIERTDHELCALFAGFLAQRNTAPLLAQAVATAYTRMADALTERLRDEGMSAQRARDVGFSVVALLEGASMIGMARGDARAFEAAVRESARMCEVKEGQ